MVGSGDEQGGARRRGEVRMVERPLWEGDSGCVPEMTRESGSKIGVHSG